MTEYDGWAMRARHLQAQCASCLKNERCPDDEILQLADFGAHFGTACLAGAAIAAVLETVAVSFGSAALEGHEIIFRN